MGTPQPDPNATTCQAKVGNGYYFKPCGKKASFREEQWPGHGLMPLCRTHAPSQKKKRDSARLERLRPIWEAERTERMAAAERRERDALLAALTPKLAEALRAHMTASGALGGNGGEDGNRHSA